MELSLRDSLTVSEHHSTTEQDDSHGNSRSLLLHMLNQKENEVGSRLHAFLFLPLEDVENKESYSVSKGHRQPT